MWKGLKECTPLKQLLQRNRTARQSRQQYAPSFWQSSHLPSVVKSPVPSSRISSSRNASRSGVHIRSGLSWNRKASVQDMDSREDEKLIPWRRSNLLRYPQHSRHRFGTLLRNPRGLHRRLGVREASARDVARWDE